MLFGFNSGLLTIIHARQQWVPHLPIPDNSLKRLSSSWSGLQFLTCSDEPLYNSTMDQREGSN